MFTWLLVDLMANPPSIAPIVTSGLELGGILTSSARSKPPMDTTAGSNVGNDANTHHHHHTASSAAHTHTHTNTHGTHNTHNTHKQHSSAVGGGGVSVSVSVPTNVLAVDLDEHSTPPGIPIAHIVTASKSPSAASAHTHMSLSILTEQLEKMTVNTHNLHEATLKLCAFLSNTPVAGDKQAHTHMSTHMNMMSANTHTERVKILLESKALELLFQQVFADNSFLQHADNVSCVQALFAHIFRLEHTHGNDGNVSISAHAIHDILNSLQTLNNAFISLKGHCKQTFTVGPLAVSRRIANTIRKVHAAFVSVFTNTNTHANTHANTNSAAAGGNAHTHTQSVGASVPSVDVSGVQSLESQLLGLDRELDNLELQLKSTLAHTQSAAQTASASSASGGDSSSSANESARLAAVLEVRELESDRMTTLLKV
jgi:hypothetical protein